MPALVSIAIPTFNGRSTIEASVRSALGQTYAPVEVVVSDDASTDGTGEAVRRLGVDVDVNRSRLGANRNWNRSVALSRGEYVKFLHQDDLLEPQCVARMVEMFDRHPSAGMVFSRRRVGLHHGTAEEQGWLDEHRSPHQGFASLHELNPAGSLSDQILANRFRDNWIGEPVCVMVRREVLEAIGGFHLEARQVLDLDMWFRVAAEYDVVFLDDELAVYRCSTSSLTGQNRSAGLNWLDTLWILEGLASNRQILARYPEIEALRDDERRMARRTVVSRRYATPSLRVWLEYCIRRRIPGRSIYGVIPPRR